MLGSTRSRVTAGMLALAAAGVLAWGWAQWHQGKWHPPGRPPRRRLPWPQPRGRKIPVRAPSRSPSSAVRLHLANPTRPRVDLGRLAALLLGGELDGRHLEVSNRAVKGRAAAAVVRDARDLVDGIRTRGALRILLYVGNNEFLGFDRRHDLRRHERTRFDTPVVNAAERAAVFERYRRNLTDIVTTLRDAGLGVVAAAPVVNFRDWDPNRSCLADPAHAPQLEALLDAGERAAAAGDPAAALRSFQAALALEPDFAAAAKRAGDCLLLLGRDDEARRAYQHAVDCDGNPYRETSAQIAILRAVCAAREVPVVDCQALLEEASPHGIVGNELLWDNCHPTLEGYLIIARGVTAALLEERGESVSLPSLTVADVERVCGIDEPFIRQIYNERGQYCYAAATLSWDPRPRLARARTYLEEATRRGPENADITCSFAVLTALEGDARKSVELWRRATGIDPQVARRRMSNPYVVQIMKRHGVDDLAAAIASPH